jgi:hypothetical protein
VAKIRVKLNSKGVRELLNSPEVQADLLERAERIRAAAGSDEDFVVHESTSDRAGAVVVTASHEGRRAEAEDRVLTQAIDAGR